MCSGAEEILTALSVLWQVNPRSDARSTSSSLWPYLRARRVTDDTCFIHRAPVAQKPSGGPPAALPGAGVRRNARSDGADRPAPAAQDLGVGLRRPCRGETCKGVLGAMAQTALARNAALGFFRTARLFFGFSNRRETINEGRR
jgi:hypothetical protein